MSSKCQNLKFQLVLKIFFTTAAFARLAETCQMFLFLDIEIRSSPSFEIPNPAVFILAVGVV